MPLFGVNMGIKEKQGIKPQLREYLSILEKALSGDIVLVIDPETVTPVPTSALWTRNVKLSYQTAAGEVHTWLNFAQATILSVGDTSTAGTATIAATTLTVVKGEATIVVSGDAADWLNTETDTLTVATTVVAGIDITGGTSVETFTT